MWHSHGQWLAHANVLRNNVLKGVLEVLAGLGAARQRQSPLKGKRPPGDCWKHALLYGGVCNAVCW